MASLISSDLISATTLKHLADFLAAIYDRYQAAVGTGTEPTETTLDLALSATAMTVQLVAPAPDGWVGLIPDVGTIVVENERIRYAGFAGGGTGYTILTILTRGADGTTPAAHADNAQVFLPASCAVYARRMSEEIVGDGSTVYGVGESAAQVIINLFSQFDAQKEKILTTLYDETFEYFSALESNIQQVAAFPGILTAIPSFGAISINNLNDYLRYLNDRTSGTPFNTLFPWQAAKLYWLAKGGALLNNKVVYPARVTYGSGGGNDTFGTVSFTLSGDEINRYGVEDENTWTQGYAAQRLQARVTLAGDGTVDLSAVCQGMDVQGKYFGRPATVTVHFAAPVTVGTVLSINGRDFTAIAGADNPDPNPDDEFAVGTTDLIASNNLYNAILASTSPLIQDLITATWLSDSVLLEVSDPDSTANFLVTSSNTTVTIDAGTQIGLDRATFGGGAGVNDDGFGADSDIDGADATQDDTRVFSGTLDLSAVGNVCDLLNGVTLDRAMKILSLSNTPHSITADSSFVIESIQERTTP